MYLGSGQASLGQHSECCWDVVSLGLDRMLSGLGIMFSRYDLVGFRQNVLGSFSI